MWKDTCHITLAGWGIERSMGKKGIKGQVKQLKKKNLGNEKHC